MSNKELKQEDVEAIISEHHAFFNSKQTLPIAFRIEQLKKLKKAIIRFESRITDALEKDLGKHPFETYTSEIGFVLTSISHTLKHLQKWVKPRKVSTSLTLFPAKSSIMYEPYGTVLIIGPFNYPFQLLIEPLLGAMAAGNCVVLKPSEVVPNVSAVIKEMIDATFNPTYIRSVEGGIDTNTALINSSFDYIFFTGSVPVGKIVMAAAAKNLVPVTLELGGKSPVIVDNSANIKVAAQRIIWGKTLNSGQTCVAPDYALVHESIKNELVKVMTKTVQQFYGSDSEKSKDFGRIVNDKHFTRLENMLKKDADGILFGGKTNSKTRYVEPTIIDVSWESSSMSEEVFGPILPILTYTDLDVAITSIKKLPKPLALYLFTSNEDVVEQVLQEVSSGGVSINDTLTHLANPELPFGGVGNSGIGSYHGIHSFNTFSHQKSVLRKASKSNIRMLYPPYNQKKLKLIRRLLK